VSTRANTVAAVSDLWVTNPVVFNPVNARFAFDLDVCASDGWAARVPNFITPEEDAFKVDWLERVKGVNRPVGWMNNPFSTTSRWVARAWEMSERGLQIVVFGTAATDTKVWHKTVLRHAAEIIFLPRVPCLAGEDIYYVPSKDVVKGGVVVAKAGKRTLSVRKGELGLAPPKGNALYVFTPGFRGRPSIDVWDPWSEPPPWDR
jgi:phage N-6-adenine-methyltransferase